MPLLNQPYENCYGQHNEIKDVVLVVVALVVVLLAAVAQAAVLVEPEEVVAEVVADR
jgi:hypothetical protein